MDIWLVVASAAVILTSLQLLPQVYKSLRTRHLRDLSIGFTVIIMLASASWLAYGFHIEDTPLILANSVNLIASALLFLLKIIEKG